VILVEPTRILCADEKQAEITAARAIPEAHLAHLEEVEIAIRPF
jgi:hypothetical protein